MAEKGLENYLEHYVLLLRAFAVHFIGVLFRLIFRLLRMHSSQRFGLITRKMLPAR